MIHLVPIPRADIVIDRQWLVVFNEGEQPAWWARFLKPGFRHVVACAWFDDQERWVYYNPARTGTVILLYRDEEFGPRLSQMLAGASMVLRVRSNRQRLTTPFGWWCTGAIKALVGLGCSALTPWSLSRALIRAGAEVVSFDGALSKESPVNHRPRHDIFVWRRRNPTARSRSSTSA